MQFGYIGAFVEALFVLTRCSALVLTRAELSNDGTISVNHVAICSITECAAICGYNPACLKFGYLKSQRLCYISQAPDCGQEEPAPEGMSVYRKRGKSGVDIPCALQARVLVCRLLSIVYLCILN